MLLLGVSGGGTGAVLVHEPMLLQEPLHPPYIWVLHTAGTVRYSQPKRLSYSLENRVTDVQRGGHYAMYCPIGRPGILAVAATAVDNRMS